MVIISSSVVGLKKIDSRNDPDRKSLCEQGGGCIFFARLGPILEKQLQNLFGTSTGSEIGCKSPGCKTAFCKTPGCKSPRCNSPGCKTPGCTTSGCKTPVCKRPGCKTPGCKSPGSKTPWL